MTDVRVPLAHLLSKIWFNFAAICLLMIVAGLPASAQGYWLIRDFSADGGGAFPEWSPTIDQFGNLYVTTYGGGNPNCPATQGCGMVLKGTLRNGDWTWNTLYAFTGGVDGRSPSGPVLVDRSGAVYGAGIWGQHGIVYQLRPPATRPASAVTPWHETVLFRFDGTHGDDPEGPLAIDPSGNIYGVTRSGGIGNGTVYQLTHTQGGWTETTLYQFQGGDDGVQPNSGLLIDGDGNLYGVTSAGFHCGTVWQMTNDGFGRWAEGPLYVFQDLGDGCYPGGPLVRDAAGNLFGVAWGNDGASVVYELSPANGGPWTFSVLLSFPNDGSHSPATGSLALDNAGNVYGVTARGGLNGGGNLFELSPSGGTWTYTDLYDFSLNQTGGAPNGVSGDSQGNLFGTTYVGGTSGNCSDGCGTVWDFVP